MNKAKLKKVYEAYLKKLNGDIDTITYEASCCRLFSNRCQDVVFVMETAVSNHKGSEYTFDDLCSTLLSCGFEFDDDRYFHINKKDLITYMKIRKSFWESHKMEEWDAILDKASNFRKEKTAEDECCGCVFPIIDDSLAVNKKMHFIDMVKILELCGIVVEDDE